VRARLTIGGQSVGTTPDELTLPVCSRTLTASLDDGRTATAVLHLEEGKLSEVTLEPIFVGPTAAECDNGVSSWPYWLGGSGLLLWAGAGGGALLVHSSLQGLPAGDSSVNSKMAAGTALMVASNIGAVAAVLAAYKLFLRPDVPRKVDPRCHGTALR
jgi:hypothetical protein